MSRKEIIERLQTVYNELDTLQETDLFQESDSLMDEIGEAMGYVDNCIGMIEEDNTVPEVLCGISDKEMKEVQEYFRKKEAKNRIKDCLGNLEDINGCPVTDSIIEEAEASSEKVSAIYEVEISRMVSGTDENIALERTLAKANIAAWYLLISNEGTADETNQSVFASVKVMKECMDRIKSGCIPEENELVLFDDLGDPVDMHFVNRIVENPSYMR